MQPGQLAVPTLGWNLSLKFAQFLSKKSNMREHQTTRPFEKLNE
jgi:hypothetical protein